MEIEESTRLQSSNKLWFAERRWRLTASRFGDICQITHRRNISKLCKSLLGNSANLRNEAILHGKNYESRAINIFSEKTHLKVSKCGLYVCEEKPFLGASPDGVVGQDRIVEIKCPFNGRNQVIAPGKCFSFLTYNDSHETILKTNSKYYQQVQGQLYISNKKSCYFVVFTFEDMFIQHIPIDREYCEGSLIPKLELFYFKHFRPYLCSLL